MAGARYKKLNEFTDVLYTMDSPVVVEKMVHCFDTLYGVKVLQISFRNVSGAKLYGLSLGIDLYDVRGKKVKSIDFNYYAMEILQGKTFGSSEDIMVEPEAVRFELTVKGADLENGSRFKDKLTLDRVPHPIPLHFYVGDYEELFIRRFEETYPKAKLICAPENKPDYWRCTCGRIWPHEAPKCTYCRTKPDELFALLPQIKKEEKERLENERDAKEEAAFRAAEKARLVEEAYKSEEEKRRRIAEQKVQEELLAAQEAEANAKAEEARRKKRKRNYILALVSTLVLCTFMFYVIPTVKSYHERRNELASTESAITPGDNQSGNGDEIGKGEETKTPDYEIPFLVVGDGINASNEEIMRRLLGTADEKSSEYDKMDVTTNEGHVYMDGVIGRANVEPSAVSGVIVCPEAEGGLKIQMYNIDYYTEDDFREQIKSMGIENAEVVVAAPTGSSGSTAMLGLLKFAQRSYGFEGKEIGTAVAKENMNIRTSNSIQSQRLTTVPAGTELKVLEVTDNAWYKVLWPTAESGYAFTSNYKGWYYDFTFLGPAGVRD